YAAVEHSHAGRWARSPRSCQSLSVGVSESSDDASGCHRRLSLLPRNGSAVVLPCQPWQESLGERADAEGVNHRADSDASAEQPPETEHADFDAGAYQPNRPAGDLGQPGHQSVAWAGAEAGAHVTRGGDGVEYDPADEQYELDPEGVLFGKHRTSQINGDGDDDDVGHGADAEPLPQWQPQQ